jgi:hypothetical protein
MYWSAIHGLNGEQAAKDLEGVWQAQVIARNMAELLKMKAAAIESGKWNVPPPMERIKTNFIR